MKLSHCAAALIAIGLALPSFAQSDHDPVRLGAEKTFREFNQIRIRNFQDESLGRIVDLGIDLVNGRIVEVLVVSDSSLDVGDKIVAVPPLALVADPLNGVYRTDMSTEAYKTAPAIDLSQWEDAGRSDKVASVYRFFGQEPYFLETGNTASKTEARPKVTLGYVERSSKILNLPVQNFKGDKFGKVWTLTFDIINGRILTVIIMAPGLLNTKSIIPATALSFNDKRNVLLLDDSKLEFSEEPRYVFTEAAFGNDASSQEESYKGPHTSVALEQGNSYRDVDTTVRINKDIRAMKIKARDVQVGTIHGRVTLRGQVNTSEDKQHINEIAIAASRLELVDNQITVRPHVKNN